MQAHRVLEAHRVPMLLLRTLLGLLLLSLASPAAAFSQLVNGQSFTFGLSIIDAPFPNRYVDYLLS